MGDSVSAGLLTSSYLCYSRDSLPADNLAAPSTEISTPFLQVISWEQPRTRANNTHTYPPALEHRNTATPAISSGSPSLPRGLSLLSSSTPPRLLMRPWASFDGKKPGAMMLDVMFFGPSSTAKFRARCYWTSVEPDTASISRRLTLTAAFDVEYIMVPCSPT